MRSHLGTDVVHARYGCSVRALCVLGAGRSHAGSMARETILRGISTGEYWRLCPRWGEGLCDVAAAAVNTQELVFIVCPSRCYIGYPEGLSRYEL